MYKKESNLKSVSSNNSVSITTNNSSSNSVANMKNFDETVTENVNVLSTPLLTIRF